MAITFNFKKKKKEEPERFNFPVITQKPYSGEKSSVAKFALNKAALLEMRYPEDLRGCKLSVAMDDVSGEIVLINSTDMITEHQFNVNMDGTVNSKFLMERLTKFFGHSPVEEVDFSLEHSMDEDSGYSIFYVDVFGKDTDMLKESENLDGLFNEEDFYEKEENPELEQPSNDMFAGI